MTPDQRFAAIAAGRQVIGPIDPAISQYGSDQAYQCAGCGSWPLGGFAASQAHAAVVAASSRLGTAVWATVDDVLRVFCGQNCIAHHTREVARGNRPSAAKPTPVAVAAAKPVVPHVSVSDAPVPVENREVKFRCERCTQSLLLDEQRVAGGQWPDSSATARRLGWQTDTAGVARWCSRSCQALCREERPPVVPVTTINDASYRLARAGMSGREVADGRPAKKGGR